MSSFVHNQHRIRVAAPADVALMFFTPAGEELWVDGWQPRYVRPADGATSAGMVFTTGEGAQYTIWQMLAFDRARGHSRYVRTTPALRTGFVDVQCIAIDAGTTEVVVGYEMTALTEAGEASLAAYEGEAFVQMIEGWAEAIAGKLPLLLGAAIR